MSCFELVRTEAAQNAQERKIRPSIRRLCGLLKVSPSGFYDWCKRRETATAQRRSRTERLTVAMRAIQEEVDWNYGSRRLHRELVANGEQVGRRRVRRLVRENNLYPIQKKRFKRTTDSGHSLGYSPNLLNQNFSTTKPDEAWVSDITYVWTAQGWSYLATVIDLYSRRLVGWAIDDNMKTDLVVKALERAVELRSPGPGLIVHTDRGSQYASAGYRATLRKNKLLQSMSGTGNCYDNAVAESFFASLKKECVSRYHFATRTEAFDAIRRYIEEFYNPRRRHSTLGYLSPINYEKKVTLPEAA